MLQHVLLIMFRNLVGENLGDENLHSATNAIKIVKI